MKTIFSIILFTVLGICCADATTMCITDPNNISWSDCTYEQNQYTPDWKLSCADSNIVFSGVAVCGSQSGSNNDIASQADVNSTASNNKYCWCKMGYPFNSHWVLRASYGSNGNCIQKCPYNCANGLKFTSSFRAAMLGL